MNWMIDGANGDLYRTAMNYPQLQNAADEWEIERKLGRKSQSRQPLFAAARSKFVAAFAKLDAAFRAGPAVQEKLS